MTPEEAFDGHHQAVYRFAYRLTRGADVAEDITQECFLALVRAPERFNPARGTVQVYLFAIARNLALKHYRSQHAGEPLDDDAAPAAVIDPRQTLDLASAVVEAVSGPPQLQKEALVLFEYEGATLEEIAQIVGADAGAVKSRLNRARARLRRALAPYRKVGNGNGTVGPPTGKNTRTTREGLQGQGIPFVRMVSRAYNVPEYLIMGPAWMASERYALTALVSAPEDLQPLLQKELAGRFHLLAHRETRSLPVYVLQTIPGQAAKLSPAAAAGSGQLTNGSVTLTSVKLAEFANDLAGVLSRPVIDNTGIDGRFDIALTWLPANPLSLQEAAKDQLGLQMTEEKRGTEILVVEHAEKLGAAQ